MWLKVHRDISSSMELPAHLSILKLFSIVYRCLWKRSMGLRTNNKLQHCLGLVHYIRWFTSMALDEKYIGYIILKKREKRPRLYYYRGKKSRFFARNEELLYIYNIFFLFSLLLWFQLNFVVCNGWNIFHTKCNYELFGKKSLIRLAT